MACRLVKLYCAPSGRRRHKGVSTVKRKSPIPATGNVPAGRVAAILGAAFLMLFPSCGPPPGPPPDGTPRLVLLIVVDQMRADYLIRFGDLFEGGLARLIENGVAFTEAHHDHSATLTAPGHATLATGCHPARHGVIGNYWYDRETGEPGYAVEDGGPSRLLCPALGDWLKQRYPAARVVTASQKDRSAVMMGGKNPDGVYWYDWQGGFETSDHYTRRPPEWVTTFNEERGVDAFFGEAWSVEPLAPETAELLAIDSTSLGFTDPDFPHAHGGPAVAPGESFYEGLYVSPVLDDHLARFAVRAVYAEGLGEDEIPDLLALGFSALDTVGHVYGPNSREVMETLLALDRTLGRLLDELDEKIGLENMVVALTSDHGTAPVPELRALQGLSGGRMGAGQAICLQRLDRRLDERLGAADWMIGGGFLNPEALAEHGVETAVAEAQVRQIVETCPEVARVWTRGELSQPAEGAALAEGTRRRFANSFHPQRSPDFLVQWDEYFLGTTRRLSTHGTAYRYDTWVPLVVMASGLEPAEVTAPVRTVDLAPTLAALVDVEPPAEIDGEDLGSYF